MHFSTTTLLLSLTLLTQAHALPDAVPDFHSIAKRSPAAQGDLLRRMDDAARAQVWADRIDAYRQDAGNLSTAQTAVLDQGAAMLKGSAKASLADLKDATIAAFGFDEAKKLLTSLGNEHTARALPLGARQDTPYCECATADSWCDGGLQCVKKSKSCTTVPNDCGTFWTDDCDGLCYAT